MSNDKDTRTEGEKYKELANNYIEMEKRNHELFQKNNKLKEALEFYADYNNWKSGFSLKEDDAKRSEHPSGLRRGGKRARQALKECFGEEG